MTDRFSPDEVVALRSRLAEERVETTQRIVGLTRDFDAMVASAEGANTDDEHDPEGQTIGFERAQVAALLAEATGRLTAIDLATVRLGDGGDGRCGTCGNPISYERLLATPTTTACIDCATVAERTRRRSR